LVCIALGYGLDDWGSRVRFLAGLGIFLFITVSRTALGSIQPPIQWVPRALSLGVKRPGCELTTHLHLVPKSRMPGAIHPLTQYAFMAWCLVKNRDKFTFYLIPLVIEDHMLFVARL
jgi:hypothetical protein